MLKAGGFLSGAEKKECRWKKRHIIAFSLMISISFLCGTALAVPMWTDTVDPDDKLIKPRKTVWYWHDLTDDGFVPGNDHITGYTLTLSLFDDKDSSLEKALVILPGFIGFYDFGYLNNEYGWSLAGSISLNAFGKYFVAISSLEGDFYFAKSILTATGYSNTAPVPEPASMLLFGTGLIVFGLAGRKLKAR